MGGQAGLGAGDEIMRGSWLAPAVSPVLGGAAPNEVAHRCKCHLIMLSSKASRAVFTTGKSNVRKLVGNGENAYRESGIGMYYLFYSPISIKASVEGSWQMKDCPESEAIQSLSWNS